MLYVHIRTHHARGPEPVGCGAMGSAAYLGEGVGQSQGVSGVQQAGPAQHMLQVLAPQQALHHVGSVQAVDAVDARYAALPLLVAGQGARLEEAMPPKVLLDFIPQP